MMIEFTSGDQRVEGLLRLFRPLARARPDETYWLALDDGEPVGVLAGHHHWNNWEVVSHPHDRNEEASWIAELYVVTAGRGRGLGSELVEAFLDDARRTPNRLALTWPSEADDDHGRRVEFFARRGFKWTIVGENLPAQQPYLMYRQLHRT